MIHTLETITLNDFIKVYEGDVSFSGKDESEENLTTAASSMISEYASIIGGKSAQRELMNLNESLNSKIKLDLMDACDNLMKIKEWNAVSVILANMGYTILPSDHEKLKRRVSSIKSSIKLKMEMETKKKTKDKPDNDYFVKERSLLMSHYKMYIDPCLYKAKEYAYLVKRFIDEIKSIKAVGKKRK